MSILPLFLLFRFSPRGIAAGCRYISKRAREGRVINDCLLICLKRDDEGALSYLSCYFLIEVAIFPHRKKGGGYSFETIFPKVQLRFSSPFLKASAPG